MPKNPKTPKRYYYLDIGRKRLLTPDPARVALNVRLADGSLPAQRIVALAALGILLFSGTYLVARDQLEPDELHLLESRGAPLPTFRVLGATHIVLPEIIVRANARRHARIIASVGDTVETVSSKGSKLVLRPRSGSAAEALDLANRITEDFENVLACTDFLILTAVA